MGAPFTDITLYSPTSHQTGTPEYWEERALQNYISDLYIRCMHGYKPPNTTRVCIQPAYYKIWNRTWKNGSLVAIAKEFDYELYRSLLVNEKYKYVLDIIQQSMIQLSNEYNWDESVFEKAYNEVIDSNFIFKLDYPEKKSKDRKKSANLCIVKTETRTAINTFVQTDDKSYLIKLFDKKNWWWYDSAYTLAKNSKWFDNNRFGIEHKPSEFSVWYSLLEDKVQFEVRGELHESFNVDNIFRF